MASMMLKIKPGFLENRNIWSINTILSEFPSGPVVRAPPVLGVSSCPAGSAGSFSGRGTKMPHGRAKKYKQTIPPNTCGIRSYT